MGRTIAPKSAKGSPESATRSTIAPPAAKPRSRSASPSSGSSRRTVRSRSPARRASPDAAEQSASPALPADSLPNGQGQPASLLNTQDWDAIVAAAETESRAAHGAQRVDHVHTEMPLWLAELKEDWRSTNARLDEQRAVISAYQARVERQDHELAEIRAILEDNRALKEERTQLQQGLDAAHATIAELRRELASHVTQGGPTAMETDLPRPAPVPSVPLPSEGLMASQHAPTPAEAAALPVVPTATHRTVSFAAAAAANASRPARRRSKQPPPPPRTTRSPEQVLRLFSPPSGPQGYSFVYLHRSHRLSHSEVRKAMRDLDADQSRIIDVHFPVKGVVGCKVGVSTFQATHRGSTLMDITGLSNEELGELVRQQLDTGASILDTALPAEIRSDLDKTNKHTAAANIKQFEQTTPRYSGGKWTLPGALNRILFSKVRQHRLDALSVVQQHYQDANKLRIVGHAATEIFQELNAILVRVYGYASGKAMDEATKRVSDETLGIPVDDTADHKMEAT
ncbi:hypothetical protein BCR43DRAFT_503895 [Syncephalastrum racemosum]|uniref:Uncharacterized protein n=1 Tax=Syncephalastrum racemosum TaxID=13706 RepID=A0A1X2HJ92_SYNRA|nr:hypothetical protein BCR43DRAFT_503895 [Syncephalastrum racemosum]